MNNITRAEQHGASGLIATHAQFFDADSHGGGPEIPHEDECEKFGPSSAYWPPKRATRAYCYSRWLVYLLLPQSLLLLLLYVDFYRPIGVPCTNKLPFTGVGSKNINKKTQAPALFLSLGA